MAGPTLATIQKILEGMIVPEMQAVKDRLASIEGEIKGLRSEIRRLDDKIDNGLAKLETKIDSGLGRLEERIAHLDDKLTGHVARLEDRIAHLDDKLTFTNKRLDEALEIRERLAALEAKVGR
jgi:chromosome segregation ATPase